MLSRILIYSIYLAKGVNSLLVRSGDFNQEKCWHLFADNCYQEFWFYLFTYRRWEVVALAWVVVLHTLGKSKVSYPGALLIAVWVSWEMIEYWLFYNNINKSDAALALAFIFLITNLAADYKHKIL